jgi:hypothetical protein
MAHRSKQVRKIAQRGKIKLVFISPGWTDKLQPLDWRVFGVLEAYARQPWGHRDHETHGVKTTGEQMAIDLCEAWWRITQGLIQEAWDIYDGEDWRDLINEDEDAEFQEMRDPRTSLNPAGDSDRDSEGGPRATPPKRQ